MFRVKKSLNSWFDEFEENLLNISSVALSVNPIAFTYFSLIVCFSFFVITGYLFSSRSIGLLRISILFDT